MKVLYVGQDSAGQTTGTHYINNRNRACLQKITGSAYAELLCPDHYTGTWSLLRNLVTGYFGNNTKKFTREVIRYVRDERVDVVFFGHAFYGKTIRKLRKEFPNLKIIVFFHTVEKVLAIKAWKIRKSLWDIYDFCVSNYNEPLSVKYADIRITLNKRDSNWLQTAYGQQADLCLPTSFPVIPFDGALEPSRDQPLTLLFVGSKFPPNQHGIEWFVDSVMTQLPEVKLLVVGQGMEYLKDRSTLPSNVEIIGRVETLGAWYERADIVVCPIFEGGGMKTKTAEALQYGKPLLATTEAFEGYDLDFHRVGALCDSAEQFITAIQTFNRDRAKIADAARYAHHQFVERYSNQSTEETLKKMLNGLSA